MSAPESFAPRRDEPLFGRLAIIGIGLIGSSIAHAAKELNLARQIVLSDRDADVRRRARELDLGHEVAESAADAARDADHIVLCVPVGACGAVAEEIAGVLKPGAILSDVGSVKHAVVEAVSPHLPEGAHFVPAHPVAGTENSGPDAGFPSLFLNRWCILTPQPGTDEGAIARTRQFWEGMAAIVEVMGSQHHDLVLAITSHLPHLIAYNIVGTAEDLAAVTQSEVIKFSAGGFRDFTRIAASDPTMWRDVFLANKEAVLATLQRFNEDLTVLQQAIRRGDADKLEDWFTRTRAIRRSIIAEGQDDAAPDFGRKH